MKLISLWREKRKDRGLPMRIACEQMGISQGTLSLLERGVTLPKRATLERACQFYGCQPGDLYKVVNNEKEISAP